MFRVRKAQNKEGKKRRGKAKSPSAMACNWASVPSVLRQGWQGGDPGISGAVQ